RKGPQVPGTERCAGRASCEQHHHASVYPRLEDAGLCPALSHGGHSVIVNDADDCVVLGKAVDGIRDSGYADGGHVDDDTTQTDDERSQDPVRALSGPSGPTNTAAIDAHTTQRLRQGLGRKHKVKSGTPVHVSNTRLWDTDGLIQRAPTTKSVAWATS
ncbi:MAG: hypothetical protein OXC68_15200, partial [Aestuariivita sp.]|nr:hypothetical protein [Aestuariivita sp.]